MFRLIPKIIIPIIVFSAFSHADEIAYQASLTVSELACGYDLDLNLNNEDMKNMDLRVLDWELRQLTKNLCKVDREAYVVINSINATADECLSKCRPYIEAHGDSHNCESTCEGFRRNGLGLMGMGYSAYYKGYQDGKSSVECQPCASTESESNRRTRRQRQ